MSSRSYRRLQAGVIAGLPHNMIRALYMDDLRQRMDDPRVRPMPTYSRANPDGWGRTREYKHYGAPHYGSNYGLSAEEFRSHFMYGHDKFPLVLEALHLPDRLEYQPARLGRRAKYVDKEVALLIFLKRIRTRGSCLIHLVSFFGRCHGYISDVYKAVLRHLNEKYLSRQVRRLDPNIFHRDRIRDYAKTLQTLDDGPCLLDRLICFIDGSFHPTCRPGSSPADYENLLQRAFYSGHHKAHGLNFEFLTFPDGMVGRCFGPVEGRHHDVHLANEGRLLDLFRVGGPLHGYIGYGDKAYISMEPYIFHPFFGFTTRDERRFNGSMSSMRVEVEHDIGHVYSRAAFIQHEMRLRNENPGIVFLAAVFLHNIHTCVYGNQTACRFMCPPPTLDEYLYQV